MRLTPQANRLWNRLRQEPALTGFILVGGSALALHFGHRISEDLDFIFRSMEEPPSIQLPRAELRVVMSQLETAGASVQANDSPADWLDFERQGMDLHDYQQSYVVDGVKLSFFIPEPALAKLMRPGVIGGPRLAEEDELFQSKALVSASRSKTRDWFDLYYLMTERGHTMEEFMQTFARVAGRTKADIALARLCSGKPSQTDEGFAALVASPPSLEEMTAFFRQERDRWERAHAEQARAVGDPQLDANGLVPKPSSESEGITLS